MPQAFLLLPRRVRVHLLNCGAAGATGIPAAPAPRACVASNWPQSRILHTRLRQDSATQPSRAKLDTITYITYVTAPGFPRSAGGAATAQSACAPAEREGDLYRARAASGRWQATSIGAAPVPSGPVVASHWYLHQDLTWAPGMFSQEWCATGIHHSRSPPHGTEG